MPSRAIRSSPPPRRCTSASWRNSPLRAMLAARAGLAALAQATIAWLEDPAVPLNDRLGTSLAELKALLAAD